MEVLIFREPVNAHAFVGDGFLVPRVMSGTSFPSPCNMEDTQQRLSILTSIYLHRRIGPSGRNSSANGVKHTTTLGPSRVWTRGQPKPEPS